MWRLRYLCRASYPILREGHEPCSSVSSIPKRLARHTQSLGLAGFGAFAAWIYIEIRDRRTIATPPGISSPPTKPTRWDNDLARLNLPDELQYTLRASRYWLEHGETLSALAAAQIAAGHEAAKGAEFRSSLGELFCDCWIQYPQLLRKLVALAAAKDLNVATMVALMEETRRLLLSMMLDKMAQDVPAVPSVQWLTVESIFTPPLAKAFTDKLAADLLETDLRKERADILPILMDIDRPDMRILQLAVLRECLANLPAQITGGGDPRTRMATCSLKLADKCIDDLIEKRENDIGPKVAQHLVILHLHNTALRLLPPEADARELGTASETRDAFAELHIQRCYLSEIVWDGKNRRHLVDALTWLDPSSPRYAQVKRAHDRIVLRVIQLYREEHGKEIV